MEKRETTDSTVEEEGALGVLTFESVFGVTKKALDNAKVKSDRQKQKQSSSAWLSIDSR